MTLVKSGSEGNDGGRIKIENFSRHEEKIDGRKGK